jgi:hypothetical protein
MAFQGDATGPVSGNGNIVWGVANGGVTLSCGADGTRDRNIWQGCSQPNFGPYGTASDNCFVSPVPTAGTNPHIWQEADVLSNLGNSSANIDAAISALESAFGQTVQQIHDDATIEPQFDVLKSVIGSWKLVNA